MGKSPNGPTAVRESLAGPPSTMVDLPPDGPDGGRSADIPAAWRVGGSTIVLGAA
jgi:hypothetical protein